MNNPFPYRFTRVALAVIPLFALPGCATSQAVPEQIPQVKPADYDQRLARLEEALRQANLTAQQAKAQAGDALARAQDLEARLGRITEAGGQANPSGEGKLIESVTLTGDRYMYPLNAVELDGADTALLDRLAARLKTLDHPYHLEIQGHTDNSGNGEYNYLLGEARANAVGRYLHSHGGIPLHRISVISYGAGDPQTDPGKDVTSNRRVDILVLR